MSLVRKYKELEKSWMKQTVGENGIGKKQKLLQMSSRMGLVVLDL